MFKYILVLDACIPFLNIALIWPQYITWSIFSTKSAAFIGYHYRRLCN